MNRIDRISAILIQLQSKKIVKGQDIADRFSISLRTAYRDIKTLEEAGVPILSEAGVGYSLMDGYRLPPVMFSKEEALSFITAEKLVEKLTDPGSYALYQSALFKIKAVLKSDDKEHLDTMSSHIEVLENPYLAADKLSSDHIQVILESISKKRVLSITYFANHSQQNTQRTIEALGLFFRSNHWYLIAYCWLRKDYRTFRLDRIPKISITQTAFKKEHPSLKTYLKEIIKENRDLHKVVMRVDKDILKHLREQKFYNGFVSETEVKGKIEMTFLSSSLEGFARWFMMFGDQAEIVSPQSLKTRIHEIASEIKNKTK